MSTTTTTGQASAGSRLHPAPGTYVAWRNVGLLMSITFAVLYLLSEVGPLMAVPLYGSMAGELQLTPAAVSWALLASTIAGAATIALISRAGDVFGHRRILLISLAVVTVGFILSAAAPNFELLVVGRAMVGVIAAKPALVLAIVDDRLAPADRHRAIILITSGLAVAVFVGFALGGVFLALGTSWRAPFLAAGVLTALAFGVVAAFVPESDAASRSTGRRSFDLAGVVLLGAGLTGVCIALNQATTWGFGSAEFWIFLLVGLALSVAFVVWELRAKEPLVDLRLAASRRLWPSYGIWAVIGTVAFFLYSMVVTYAQTDPAVAGYGFGLSPLLAGFVLLPVTVGGLITSRLAPKMIKWWGPRTTLIVGTVGFFLGFLWLAFFHQEIWQYEVGIMMFGLSVTTMITVAVATLVGEAPKGKAAATTGLYIVLATTAVSIGTALYGLCMGSSTLSDGITPAPAAFQLGYVITVVVSAIGIVIAFFLPKDSKASQGASH
jgi:predicted MFS family arabinose efflux permease